MTSVRHLIEEEIKRLEFDAGPVERAAADALRNVAARLDELADSTTPSAPTPDPSQQRPAQ